MFFNSHPCGLVRKTEEGKYIVNLILDLISVGGYDFPHQCVGPWHSYLFFELPVGSTVTNVLGMHSLQRCGVIIVLKIMEKQMM
jgi:hypothetical protein